VTVEHNVAWVREASAAYIRGELRIALARITDATGPGEVGTP